MTTPDYPRCDLPGLRDEPGRFEWAYDLGDDGFGRVRYVANPIEATRRGEVNIPVAPFAIGVLVSLSFVGSDGQVDRPGGRGLVTPEEPHSWQFGGGSFDEAVWLEALAQATIRRWLPWARQMRTGGLLAAAPADAVPAAAAPAFILRAEPAEALAQAGQGEPE